MMATMSGFFQEASDAAHLPKILPNTMPRLLLVVALAIVFVAIAYVIFAPIIRRAYLSALGKDMEKIKDELRDIAAIVARMPKNGGE
jgi:flagellar biosynthesis/type III secretory pathway M-ring protein FliF/YscJ